MESAEACLTLLYKSLKLPLNEAFDCIYGQSGLPVSLLNGVIDCRLKNKDLNAAVKFITGYFRKLDLPTVGGLKPQKIPFV